ncbi:MAG: hypothetical protein IIZ33_04055 [Erysipelotrichaceae bacterium]|nr:hypothetical protein [Erysipelotrichaceae bacterium]
MKKLIALLLSLGLTGVGMLVNYLGYLDRNYLPLGIHMDGGEYTSEIGFGLHRHTIHAMMPGEPNSYGLRFEPVSFIVSVLVFFLIALLILNIIEKRKAS